MGPATVIVPAGVRLFPPTQRQALGWGVGMEGGRPCCLPTCPPIAGWRMECQVALGQLSVAEQPGKDR